MEPQSTIVPAATCCIATYNRFSSLARTKLISNNGNIVNRTAAGAANHTGKLGGCDILRIQCPPERIAPLQSTQYKRQPSNKKRSKVYETRIRLAEEAYFI